MGQCHETFIWFYTFCLPVLYFITVVAWGPVGDFHQKWSKFGTIVLLGSTVNRKTNLIHFYFILLLFIIY